MRKMTTQDRSLAGFRVLYGLGDLLFLWPATTGSGMVVCRTPQLLRGIYAGVPWGSRGAQLYDVPVADVTVVGYARNWKIVLHDESRRATGAYGSALRRLGAWIDNNGWGYINGGLLQQMRSARLLEWETRPQRHSLRFDELEAAALHTKIVLRDGRVTAVPFVMTTAISRGRLLLVLQEGTQHYARICSTGGK